MSNKIIICPGVSSSDLPNGEDETIIPDQFFVGSRIIDDHELQFVIGARAGEEFHVAAILDVETAEKVCQQIKMILECASNNQEPVYKNPASVTLPTNADMEKALKMQGASS